MSSLDVESLRVIHRELCRGAARGSVPPISLVLATNAGECHTCLCDMQYWVSQEDGVEALNHWVSTFSAAVIDACRDADAISREMGAIRDSWVR